MTTGVTAIVDAEPGETVTVGVIVTSVVISTTVNLPEPTGMVSVRVTSETWTVCKPETVVVLPIDSVTVETATPEVVHELLGGIVTTNGRPEDGVTVITLPETPLGEGFAVTVKIPGWVAEMVCVLAGSVTVIGEPDKGVTVMTLTATELPT